MFFDIKNDEPQKQDIYLAHIAYEVYLLRCSMGQTSPLRTLKDFVYLWHDKVTVNEIQDSQQAEDEAKLQMENSKAFWIGMGGIYTPPPADGVTA